MDDFFRKLFEDDSYRRKRPLDDQEPSFDINDFRKWLKHQHDEGEESMRESVERKRKENLRQRYRRRRLDS